jgi:hypothetical protein
MTAALHVPVAVGVRGADIWTVDSVDSVDTA